MKRSALPTLAFSLFTTAVLAEGGFYGDPPDATHPWAIHDMNRPQPMRVEPGTFSSQEVPGTPPSDAVILFGGKPEEIEKWISDKNGEPTKWVVKDNVLQCVPGSGYIRTKEEFSDCQLHIEWSAPNKVEGNSQGRGNSGVFLMGQVEVQVLDNYNNPSYPDGMASSIYGINPPLANPLRAPGEWQTYDIVFRRPIFKDGKEIDPGYITVFVNGVLTQDHTPLEGGGGHMKRSKPRAFPDQGPLKIQDHGNPVRFRNIWYRPLPKRAVEGGEASRMSEEATAAKRAEIAKGIREDATKLEGNAKMLRLFESLCYEPNEDANHTATLMLGAFVTDMKNTAADKIESKKGEIMQVTKALRYLTQFKFIPDNLKAKADLEAIIKAQDWEPKKK
ncbi:DUF1080 domain-containing protein [Prosthecobacter sp.]|uniref:3-keto-disaccharide hydrolase n=1 Tax=Prosthecobacter sp. TaxID=1965333 RepID=UPI002ABCE0F9|nr:DUF1080 domain-containing protein [Prosthecobacter sp.]MDZ4402210.1 DUF1080 domain-containing protein [Prosthecobacter sp.]